MYLLPIQSNLAVEVFLRLSVFGEQSFNVICDAYVTLPNLSMQI